MKNPHVTPSGNDVRDRKLGREIAIILIIKLFILIGIKLAFFSDPVSKELTPDKIANSLFESSS